MPQASTRTLVTFLLDRTGSMEAIRDDTIGGFNAYLDGLKGDGEADIEFTLIQFDSVSIDKICVAVPIAKVDKLTRETYQPRASTPLIDAAVKTINAVEASLLTDPAAKVVICFQTDGQENSSTEHTWAELNALVKENKPFTMMAYPNRSHGIFEGRGTQLHLYELLTRYLHEHLPVEPRAN